MTRREILVTIGVVLICLPLAVSLKQLWGAPAQYLWVWWGDRWPDDPGYYIDTHFEENLACPAAAAAAIAAGVTWSNVSDQSFDLVYRGLRNGDYSPQQNWINDVQVVYVGDRALSPVWVSAGEIVECDMLIDPGYPWSAADNCPEWALDVQNVAAHEFGHWAGFGDVGSPEGADMTMYASADYGETKKRTLHAEDIDGLQYVYEPGQGGGGCAPARAFEAEGGTVAQLDASLSQCEPGYDIGELCAAHEVEFVQVLGDVDSLRAVTEQIADTYEAEMQDIISGGDGGVVRQADIDRLDAWLALFCENASAALRRDLMELREVLEGAQGWTGKELLLMELGGGEGGGKGVAKAPQPAPHATGRPPVTLTVTSGQLSGEVAIRYGLPEDSHVTLAVYDVLGRRTKTVVDAPMGAGSHATVWDGRDTHGREAPPGMYLVTVRAGERAETRKVVLAR